MEILAMILMVIFIILPIIGTVISIEPDNKWDNNYHGQYNHLKEEDTDIS